MPKAYWIGAYDAIGDADKLKAYAQDAGSALAEHGGKILARGGRSVTFEGTEKLRVVVVEFTSREAAAACYNYDAYRAAHAKLENGGVRDLYVVEGVE